MDNAIADYIIENEHIIVIAGKPYIYKDGVYKSDEDGNILRYLIKSMILEDLITIGRINRVFQLIITNHKLKVDVDDLNRHPRDWINFHNGFLDVRNMKMMEHSPEYLSINQIPHDFQTDRIVPDDSVVPEFLKGIICNEDDYEMLLEYIGYCMTTDTGLQKFLVITGPGGTGKSTLIRLINNAMGKENISGLSLQDLNERFNATNLFGKLLNSCADISSKAMEQVDIIKKITGEDLVKGEYKGGAVFFFKSYAKLMFSANEIPVSLDDKTNAYYRRFLIIKIDKRCHEIDHLEERLNESSDDFIYLSVMALQRMYQRGKLNESQNSLDNVMELYMASDTVMSFLTEEMTVGADFKVERCRFYEEYSRYCEDNDRHPLTRNGFFKNVRNKGYKELQSHGKRYFKGLKYKDSDFIPVQGEIPFNQMGAEKADISKFK